MIFSLSGSHNVGKTTLFNLLKENDLLKGFTFLPEVAKALLNVLQKDAKTLLTANPEIAFRWEWMINEMEYFKFDIWKNHLIITDRTFIDSLAYSKVNLEQKYFNLIYNKVKYNIIKYDIYTFLIRNKKEDTEIIYYIKKYIDEFHLPFEEVYVPEMETEEGKQSVNMEIANQIANKIIEISKEWGGIL
ncbi:AAA family ATPase [bacterium]|nr:AAA family ATPase [bacterium]